MKYAYAYVIIGQDVFGLGDTAEAALIDAAQYVEGGLDEAQSRLDSGSAVIVQASEARTHCRAGESSILPQFGL